MLIDTTLREGEQLFGAYFTERTRREIVLRLWRAGIEEAEVGCVGREGLAGLVEFARANCPGMAVGVWCPCREESLAEAARLGADRINVGVPVSDLHLAERLGWTRDELLARVRSVVAAAQRLGVEHLSIGLEDATRADPAFVAKVARVARWHGAFRVRLSDTVGRATPSGLARLVALVVGEGGRVAVHCHNDFGMATANAVGALEAGAGWADCSLLGIGERAGIAATEQVAAYCALEQESSSPYDLSVLAEACRLASTAADVAVPRIRPVIGRDIFRCETGLHIHGLTRHPALFEPFDPAQVGGEREMALGGKSGRAAVRALAAELGFALDGEPLARAVGLVRERARELGRPLGGRELEEMFSSTRLCCPSPEEASCLS